MRVAIPTSSVYASRVACSDIGEINILMMSLVQMPHIRKMAIISEDMTLIWQTV